MVARIGKFAGYVPAAVLLLALVLVAWPHASAPLPDKHSGYVIEGVRIIDDDAGTAGSSTSVTVRDSTIVAIWTQMAPRLVRVAGRGRFLVPSFWDMHMHSFQHSPQTGFPLFIANGVTNVRDMVDCPGGRDSLIARVADKRR
jgi:hypothetical protein